MTCIPHDEPFAFVSATVSTFTLGWFLDRYPIVIRYAWSRHFHLWQSPLVDIFYVSEASATRHTLQPYFEGINHECLPLIV